MKIAIFATHPVQYHVPWFKELSLREGYDVRVYFASIPDAEAQGVGFDVAFNWDVPLFEGYDYKLLDQPPLKKGLRGFVVRRWLGIYKALQQERPDVVIVTGWQAFFLLQTLFYAVVLRIPRIVRGESNGLKPRNWKVRLAHKMLLRWYHGFLTIGKSNQQFYAGYDIAEKKMFFCPYFVDNMRFLAQIEEALPRRKVLRDKWGIPESSVCFIYAGKLVQKKRIHDQLAALALATRKESNLHLLVVGTGELMAAAEKQALAGNLPVTFAGFLNQTEITQAYAAADCLILSSDYDETWGLVVNEAMVCRRPAIVSDRCGSGPDLIEEGITGTIYPFGNISALAEAMLEMAKHPEAMQKMGKKAQQKVVQQYNVEKTVNGTLKAVESVTGQAA